MKLIVINDDVSSESKTVFLRRLETILLEMNLMSSSKLQIFRTFAAVEVLELLKKMKESQREELIQIM